MDVSFVHRCGLETASWGFNLSVGICMGGRRAKDKLMNRNKCLSGLLCWMWKAFNERNTGRKRVRVTDKED